MLAFNITEEGHKVDSGRFEEILKNIFLEKDINYKLEDSRKRETSTTDFYDLYRENNLVGEITVAYRSDITEIIFSGNQEALICKIFGRGSGFKFEPHAKI